MGVLSFDVRKHPCATALDRMVSLRHRAGCVSDLVWLLGRPMWLAEGGSTRLVPGIDTAIYARGLAYTTSIWCIIWERLYT